MTTRTNFVKRKESRRADAIGRQAAYDDMTRIERILQARNRRGESKKEIARLEKQA